VPTVGWILEGALERRLEAEDARRGPPPKVRCPYCERQFDHTEAMREHVSLDHPLYRPELMINGNVVGRHEVIRQVLDADSIQLTNSSEICATVNGEAAAVDGDVLPQWLSEKRAEQIKLVARNHRAVDHATAETPWSLDFRIAADEEIASCDAAFLRHLAIPVPTMSDVDGFVQAQSGSVGARDYAGALADFVVGMFLKEQSSTSGIRGDLRDFKGKLMSADQILCGYGTRIARSVTALSGFCLNAWGRLRVPIELSELSSAVAFFRSLAESSSPESKRTSPADDEPVCYVDEATKCIMQAAQEFQQGRTGGGSIERLDQLRKDHALTEYDLVKVNVLLAELEIHSGDQAAANTYLQRLQFDEYFGTWARQRRQG
jgi:hypothetical protein